MISSCIVRLCKKRRPPKRWSSRKTQLGQCPLFAGRQLSFLQQVAEGLVLDRALLRLGLGHRFLDLVGVLFILADILGERFAVVVALLLVVRTFFVTDVASYLVFLGDFLV